MNSLKNVVLIALLAAVAYIIYVQANQNTSPNAPPPGVVEGWGGPVQVEVPALETSAPSLGTGPGNQAAATGFPFPAGSDVSAAGPFHAGQGAAATSPASSATAKDVMAGLGGRSAATRDSPNSTAAGSESTATGVSVSAAAQAPAAVNTPGNEIRKEFIEFMNMARSKLDTGEWGEVHRVLTTWYGDPRLTAGEAAQLTDLLDQIAGTAIYSRQPVLESLHVVQPGETLQQIADSLRVPWELLAKINRISDPQNLQVGQKLKVVRGPFDAVVDLKNCELTLMLDDCYAGRFPVGIGKDHLQLEGTYVVQDKLKNPTYYGPNGITIAADDPANPLGERWIGLGDKIGLHGTNDPQSIGRGEVAGSISLSSQDIDDVFDILSVGSRVQVRR